MPTDVFNPRPCKICLVQHDDEIHEATLSVRGWFRDQVTQGFYEEPEVLVEQPETLVASQVA
jgi:hypothetical protein